MFASLDMTSKLNTASNRMYSYTKNPTEREAEKKPQHELIKSKMIVFTHHSFYFISAAMFSMANKIPGTP